MKATVSKEHLGPGNTAQGLWRLGFAGLSLAATAAMLVSASTRDLRAGPPPHSQANSNPGVFPPDSKPYGSTYGEWAAKYWQWLLSFPDPVSPAYEQGDVVYGAQNQSGPVWILESGNVGVWNRNVHVPAGKGILFSLTGAEVDTLFFPEATEQDLLGILDSIFTHEISVSGEVDGVPLQQVNQYLFLSPLFEITVPENGFGGTPAGTGQALAKGWFFVLPPLSKGEHTIHVHGEAPDFGYVSDTTYHVTVE